MKKRMIPIALAMLVLLSSCGAGSEIMTAAQPQAPAWTEGAAGELNTSIANADYNGKDSVEVWIEEGRSNSEKLIYRADLTVETLHFDAAVAALEELAAKVGGFIESSDVYGYTRYTDGSSRVVDRTADYVLRVPSGQFRETVDHVGELGSVTNSSTGVENITSQFIDMEARRHSLEVQEERLLAMLEQAEDVSVLIELESRLSEVRYEIESIERTLRNWQQQVDYSTVHVYIREVEVYSPTVPVQRTFGEKLGDALGDGWNDLVSGVQGLVLVAARLLPVLTALCAIPVIGLVVLLVCLKNRKKRRAKAAERAKAEEQKEE